MTQERKVKSLSRARLFETSWTIAYQAPLSRGLSRQYWSGLPFPSPGDLPDPGITPGSPTLQANALPSEPPGKLFPHDTAHSLKKETGIQPPLLPHLPVLDLCNIWKWNYLLSSTCIL